MWLREADLFVREVERGCQGFRGQGHGGGRRQACEGEGGRLQSVGARRQAEAGTALHGWEAQLRVGCTAPLDAASAVAPPLLHRRPHTRALRTPGGAETPKFVGARQGAALPLARWSGGV